MAWRIVKQPNGKYARFADPVDNFTHLNMTRYEAVKMCINEQDMGPKSAEIKVQRADENPQRWAEGLHTIELIHGKEAVTEVEKSIA